MENCKKSLEFYKVQRRYNYKYQPRPVPNKVNHRPIVLTACVPSFQANFSTGSNGIGCRARSQVTQVTIPKKKMKAHCMRLEKFV